MPQFRFKCANEIDCDDPQVKEDVLWPDPNVKTGQVVEMDDQCICCGGKKFVKLMSHPCARSDVGWKP